MIDTPRGDLLGPEEDHDGRIVVLETAAQVRAQVQKRLGFRHKKDAQMWCAVMLGVPVRTFQRWDYGESKTRPVMLEILIEKLKKAT